jgi:hypothetical protein
VYREEEKFMPTGNNVCMANYRFSFLLGKPRTWRERDGNVKIGKKKSSKEAASGT